MGKVFVVAARKGGVGKTTTSISLAAAMARQDEKVLIVDADSQHSATVSLGITEPDKLTVSLATVMQDIINEKGATFKGGV